MKTTRRRSSSRVASQVKHVRVRTYVEELIRDGKLGPGDKVPTESDLMKRLRVSRSPVRHALLELAREGIIYTLRGSGSYVKKTPAAAARNLHVLLYEKASGIEKDIIHGIRKAVLAHGDQASHLILRPPAASTMDLVDCLSLIDTKTPGGLILIPCLSLERSENRKLGAALRGMETDTFRVVQLDFAVPEYDGNVVMADHRGAAYDMTDLLIAEGHRKIAVVFEHPERISNKLRMEGVLSRLRESGLRLPPSLRMDIPSHAIATESRRILGAMARTGVTAVFAFQCDLAVPLLEVFRGGGVKVPDDVSLCTFDDISIVTGVQDDLVASIVQPLETMGRLAADLALGGPGRRRVPTQIQLKCSLVRRRSILRLAR